MNKEHLYRQWINSRRNVAVPPGFEDRVMAVVESRKQKQNAHDSMDQWVTSALGRWAAAWALLLLGVFRLAYIAGQLLLPGHIAP